MLSKSFRHLRLVEPPPRAEGSPQLDDSELLGAVRSGDDWAAAALCRRVRPCIEATVTRLLGVRDRDHADLVQQSLIELVRSIGRFRGDCSLETWTSRVTAHAVYKHIRRRQLERRLFDSSADDEAASVPASSEVASVAVSRALLGRVRGHLSEMEDGRAWAFLLHDVAGFDLREAARIMGVSVAAAQKRLVRGRRELRERIGQDPELADMLTREGGRR